MAPLGTASAITAFLQPRSETQASFSIFVSLGRSG
jgi:hypothetical protein